MRVKIENKIYESDQIIYHRMRDPNRLYSFYNQLLTIHVDKFPDLRFGQMMYNFSEWLKHEKGIDVFYLEENDFMKYFKEYSRWGDEYIYEN